MKVGWEINRFQEFHKKQVNNYLSQVEFLMSRSGSKDPGHCAAVFFMTLPFWKSSALSFAPHLSISGEQQVLGQWLLFSIFHGT